MAIMAVMRKFMQQCLEDIGEIEQCFRAKLGFISSLVLLSILESWPQKQTNHFPVVFIETQSGAIFFSQ